MFLLVGGATEMLTLAGRLQQQQMPIQWNALDGGARLRIDMLTKVHMASFCQDRSTDRSDRMLPDQRIITDTRPVKCSRCAGMTNGH